MGVEGNPLKAAIRVKMTKKHERPSERRLSVLKDDVRARLKQVPLLKLTVADPEFMQGAPSEAPLNVYVRGDDMNELLRLNDEVVEKIRQVPGAVDVDSSLESGQPEMLANVNRELAADLGFEVSAVAMQLRGMVEGVVPTKLREGDKEYDIRVRLAPEFRNDFETIGRTPLYSPTGAVVRARDIVRMEPAVGPANIDREARRRQAKIGVELTDRPLGDVTNDVAAVMAAVKMPANFEWGFAGDVELMQESAAAMGLALLLAVAFIYIVLASQFESFLEPFLIMLSLPLALVGALLGILLTGKNLGMPAMIGVVMLMGLVTKNAILLVDLTNQYVREGLSVPDAILKAGPIRLRPILMTTVAMILGMLPSAVGTGEGSEFRSPISIATIGGLMTSTLLTLVVVPVCVPASCPRRGSREELARKPGGSPPPGGSGDHHPRDHRARGLVHFGRQRVRADFPSNDGVGTDGSRQRDLADVRGGAVSRHQRQRRAQGCAGEGAGVAGAGHRGQDQLSARE